MSMESNEPSPAPIVPPAQPAGDGAGGAPPSNTAPDNPFANRFSLLRSGIDSLYLSFTGTLRTEWEARLLEAKAAAQSPDPTERLQAQFVLSSHLFQVRDKGRGRFAYVLQDNWYDMALASHTARLLPAAYVQVGNEPLTLNGLPEATGRLQNLLAQMADLEGAPLVSRVDLCVDFLVDLDLEIFQERSWVSRARSKAKRYENGRFTGWTFGAGGALSARLYNKSLEIQKSGKTYMYDVWAANGWLGEAEVWRLEFQLRREPLVELGVSVLPQLVPNCAALWRYCCDSWLRLE